MNTTQIIKNAASNYGRMAVGIVTTLLMTPLLLHRLGPESYGLWALTLTVAGYFGLTDLGITGAAVRYISHYRALGDWPNLNKTIGSTQCCYLLMAAVSVAASAVVAGLAPRLFHVSPQNVLAMRLLILNIGLVAVVGFVSVLPIQCVIAAQRHDVLNGWMLVSQVVTTALTAVGVVLGAGVVWLALLQLVSSVSYLVIGAVLARRFLPQARFGPAWDPAQGRLLVSFAGTAVLISIGSRVIYYTDTMVIASCLSVAAVAGYAIILKIVELMRGLVGSGTGVLGTFVSEQAALENRDSLALMWREGTKWSLVITLPLAAVLALLGPQILTAWVGAGYAAAVALPLAWLAVGQVFDLAQSSAYQILMNSGRHKTLAVLTFLEAAVNLSLSIFLVRRIGVVGVAVGTTLPLVVRSLIFYPLYMPRLTGLRLRDYLTQAVLPPALAAAPVCLLAAAYRWAGLGAGRLTLLAFAALAAALTVLGAAHFCLAAPQRTKIRALVSRRLRGRAAGVPA